MAPVEVEAIVLPLAVDDLELLGEQLRALAQRGEREAVRAVLGHVPAGAHSELDAAARDVVGSRDGLPEQRRVAEGDGGDERPEPERRRCSREPGERRPGVHRPLLGRVRERHVVVGAEERVDPVLFTRAREGEPLLPGDVLLPLDHQREPHRSGAYPALPVAERLADVEERAGRLILTSSSRTANPRARQPGLRAKPGHLA